jgi:hypothetical protein
MAEFKNTLKYITSYGNQVESEIETRLFNLGKVASGGLYDSIGYKIEETEKGYRLKFFMADYGKYVDKGTKPSKYADSEGTGTGKSKFITSLMKWCEIKGLPKGMAFPIRRKIWKLGQEPTNFFTIPTTRRQKQFVSGVKKNMAIDAEQILSSEYNKAKKRK